MGMKFRGTFGFAKQSAKGTPATAPTITVPMEDGGISNAPAYAERSSHMTAHRLKPIPSGFARTFSASGIEAIPNTAGQLAEMVLGVETPSVAPSPYTHTITPLTINGTPIYCTIFCDRNVDLGTSVEAQTLSDVIMDKFEFSCDAKGIGKINVSGPGIILGNAAGITPSLATVLPVAWPHLRDANDGYFKVQVDGGTFTLDETIKGLKFTFSQSIVSDNYELASDDPYDLYVGHSECSFEFSKIFRGVVEYNAFIAQQEVGINAKFYIDANNAIEFQVPHAYFESEPLSGVGASEDLITLTVAAKAYVDPGVVAELCTIIATDTDADY